MTATALSGASAVAVEAATGWRAALITGASGAGKSTLALSAIALGARLVGDDVVALRRRGERLIASGADGRIEARGLGILRLPSTAAEIALWLELAPPAPQPDLERLPRFERRNLLRVDLPFIRTTMRTTLAPGLVCLLREGALLDPEAPITAAP